MDNGGRVLSKAQILDHVWQSMGRRRSIVDCTSLLRKKVDGIEVDDGEGGKRKVTRDRKARHRILIRDEELIAHHNVCNS